MQLTISNSLGLNVHEENEHIGAHTVYFCLSYFVQVCKIIYIIIMSYTAKFQTLHPLS